MTCLEWISFDDRDPPMPDTPYEMYLFWAVPTIPGASGLPVLGRISKSMDVELFADKIFDIELEVTHWCDALKYLAEPRKLNA